MWGPASFARLALQGYEPVTIREAAQLEVLLFVALMFVVSLGVVYWGFQTYQFGRIVRDTPPEPVRSVAMGRTEVSGDITPHERLYDQPFTEGQCVYAEYEVREYREYPNDDDKNDRWETVETGSFATPFSVDDGTGRIRVEPNEETLYEVSDGNSTTVEVGKGERPPEPIPEFLSPGTASVTADTTDDDGGDGGALGRLRSRLFGGDEDADGPGTGSNPSEIDPAAGGKAAGPGDDPSAPDADDDHERVRRDRIGSSGGTGRKRRYIQEVLPADATVYVFGGATRTGGAGTAAGGPEVIRTDHGTGEFVVSDREQFDLADSYTARSLLYVVSGILSSTMILGLLVQILVTGPVYGIEAALP
jgi:hypothetical protein